MLPYRTGEIVQADCSSKDFGEEEGHDGCCCCCGEDDRFLRSENKCLDSLEDKVFVVYWVGSVGIRVC